ncbi:zf-HC2 domain-containing protein [Streptomyces spectabilis]|uniref:Zf-HC2 domain-containing protein n=1 Tax=Streptomyces spectabilis TaxID=68270 RepID=A0A516RH02_STRST|nr:zf-HC2 domain-containing protein [Streptomyces spectabilis]QDQ14941.1 zf-HC2 domain-containing protein [Streptomyces spectabilis]
MRSLERHRDAGAYALGVLDRADAFRFEDHLMDCPHCRARVDELALPAGMLRAHGRDLPPVPGPLLLDRLLGEAARSRRLRRRWWLGGVAAGVALAVAAPTAAVLTSEGPAPLRAAATDARGELAAVLTARPYAWGTAVDLRVRDAAGRRVCALVAVGVDGDEETVTTWRGTERALTTRGGTGLGPDRIDHFEVRAAGGARLLTLRPH